MGEISSMPVGSSGTSQKISYPQTPPLQKKIKSSLTFSSQPSSLAPTFHCFLLGWSWKALQPSYHS